MRSADFHAENIRLSAGDGSRARRATHASQTELQVVPRRRHVQRPWASTTSANVPVNVVCAGNEIEHPRGGLGHPQWQLFDATGVSW